MIEIEIDTEVIEMDKFLKFSGIAQTGGMAKIMINKGLITINGRTEKHRSRKLKHGDIVEFEGSVVIVKQKDQEV